MEIKDYVKQFRDLQKSHKKVRVADFCRENMLDYYEMVEALKQDKFESDYESEPVECGQQSFSAFIREPYKRGHAELSKRFETDCPRDYPQ